jgi:hypothetical protein
LNADEIALDLSLAMKRVRAEMCGDEKDNKPVTQE